MRWGPKAQLDIVALGPLTNVACLTRTHPALLRHLGRVAYTRAVGSLGLTPVSFMWTIPTVNQNLLGATGTTPATTILFRTTLNGGASLR